MKPHLAASGDVESLTLPKWVSFKYDGIRALCSKTEVLSRSGKSFPNDFIKMIGTGLAKVFFHKEGGNNWLDCEILVGEDLHSPSVFSKTQSFVMSNEPPTTGIHYVTFVVLDAMWGHCQKLRFQDRSAGLTNLMMLPSALHLMPSGSLSPLSMPLDRTEQVWAWPGINTSDLKEEYSTFYHRDAEIRVRVMRAEQFPAYTTEELDALVRFASESKLEGLIFRDPNGVYKQGRSTMKDQALVKLKFKEDREYLCVGWEPLLRADGTVEDMIGSLECITATGHVFKVGSGFTEQERIGLFNDHPNLRGRIVRVQSMAFGAGDVPRQPVFTGFRDIHDLDPETANALLKSGATTS